MANNFEKIQNLLSKKAELQARLNLIPYNGTVEIKEISDGKYLYIRKREAGRLNSTYVGPYSEELHQVLLKSVKDARSLQKSIRAMDRELASYGYSEEGLCQKLY